MITTDKPGKGSNATLLDKMFDGDKMSLEFAMADDSNEEITQYLNSPRSVVDTDMRFITGGGNYLTNLTLHNLTY